MDKGVINQDMFKSIIEEFESKEPDLRTYSPLSFAFVGDAVFSLMVRSIVIAKGNTNADKLHKLTSHYVKAETQAAMAENISGELSEEEADIYKRGKNAHVKGHTRSASLYTYKCATGLEALFGYLYLAGNTERMLYLCRKCIDSVDKI